MDARLDDRGRLGLRAGDAHIIRNAGGLVTDDVIRSLIVSQQLMGTDEIVVIEHSGCGLHGAERGGLPRLVPRTRPAVARQHRHRVRGVPGPRGEPARPGRSLRTHPLLRHVPVHGLIYDVATGRLHEVA